MGRLLVDLILLILLLGAGALGLLYYAGRRQPAPVKPAEYYYYPEHMWETFDHSVGNTTMVGIRLVSQDRKHRVVEQRNLYEINNQQDNYQAALDSCYEKAYAAMNTANVTLRRR